MVVAQSSGKYRAKTPPNTMDVWPAPPSLRGMYTHGGGTSFSAPVVTGAIALMLQGKPTLSQLQVRTILQTSCYKDGFTGPLTSPSPDWGWGKLDVEKAVSMTRPPVTTSASWAAAGNLRAHWLANRLIIPGWQGGMKRGFLSDWRGHKVAALRPSGEQAFVPDRELRPGLYLATLEGVGMVRRFKVLRD